MVLFFPKIKQSGQALNKKLAGLFSFSAFLLFIPAVLCIAGVLSLSGCGNKNSDASFSEQLNLIDACIQSNQFEDAVKLTEKAAENAMGLEKQLSIIKRYTKLGQYAKNKAFVEKILKKQPEVPELNAVYANILLSEGNVLEAVKYTDRLSNTKWSLLYTEVILRRAVADNIFTEEDFTDFFVRAAGATHNELWLVDAAVVEAQRGNFKKAAALTPVVPENEKYAYFWALVNYDAGNYLECVDLCKMCGSIEDAALLASDAWLMAGENKSADDYWISVINDSLGVANSASATSSAAGASGSSKKTIPKEIYSNAALYAVRTDDLENAFRILVNMSAAYPDFDEGLVVYADYALKTSGSMITEPDSVLSTLQQRKQNSVPSIPVSDALYRMETSLEKEYRPSLYVEYLRTKWLSGNSKPVECRLDILHSLERYRHDDKHDPYLTDFAVCWMLRNYYEDEARGLFDSYMAEKYDISASSYAENAAMLDDRECMIAAWFYLGDGFVDEAKKLYETYIYERGCTSDTVAAMNLAAIYNAEGFYQKALELYGNLAGHTADSVLASEIHYRMGYIQAAHDDKKNALLSLGYSVKLNPDNNKARLLLKTLQ